MSRSRPLLRRRHPEPMPPLPHYHGSMNLGGGPTAMLSVGSDPRAKEVKPGDNIGQFKLVDVNTQDITFEWKGQQVRKLLSEIIDRTASANSAPATVNSSSSAPPPPPEPVIKGALGPQGPANQFGTKSCNPNDKHGGRLGGGWLPQDVLHHALRCRMQMGPRRKVSPRLRKQRHFMMRFANRPPDPGRRGVRHGPADQEGRSGAGPRKVIKPLEIPAGAVEKRAAASISRMPRARSGSTARLRGVSRVSKISPPPPKSREPTRSPTSKSPSKATWSASNAPALSAFISGKRKSPSWMRKSRSRSRNPWPPPPNRTEHAPIPHARPVPETRHDPDPLRRAARADSAVEDLRSARR